MIATDPDPVWTMTRHEVIAAMCAAMETPVNRRYTWASRIVYSIVQWNLQSLN